MNRMHGIWGTLSLGLLLGGFASFILGVGFIAFLLLLDTIEKLQRGEFFYRPHLISDFTAISHDLIGVILIISIITAITILPAGLGGVVIAGILYAKSVHNRLTTKTTLIIGGTIGFLSGSTVAIFILPNITGDQWEPRANPLWAGIAAIPFGVLHSWLMGKWLRLKRI